MNGRPKVDGICPKPKDKKDKKDKKDLDDMTEDEILEGIDDLIDEHGEDEVLERL